MKALSRQRSDVKRELFCLVSVSLPPLSKDTIKKKKRLHTKEDELFFAEEFCFFSAFNKRETTHRLDWPDTEQ